MFSTILKKLGYNRYADSGPGYIRFDFKWYGFGRWDHCNYCPWSYGYNPRGVCFWLNSYRTAPVRLRLVHTIGVVQERFNDSLTGQFTVRFHGSLIEPYTSWSIGLFGKVYIAGDTPKWVQRLARRRAEKRWMAEYGRPDHECTVEAIGSCSYCGCWMDPMGGIHYRDEDDPARRYE